MIGHVVRGAAQWDLAHGPGGVVGESSRQHADTQLPLHQLTGTQLMSIQMNENPNQGEPKLTRTQVNGKAHQWERKAMGTNGNGELSQEETPINGNPN